MAQPNTNHQKNICLINKMNSRENKRVEYFLPEDIWSKIIKEFLLTNHKK